MNKQRKPLISYKKIIALSILFIIILGISVLAGNAKVNSVKIKFSNNHEITVLTSKTKVSEILEENHIMLSADEIVTPALEEEITTANAIVISTSGKEPTQIAEVNNESLNTNIEEIAQNYTDIVEEIITVKEEIPFETITKDVSNGSSTVNKVIQAGKKGLKEVTYKVRYKGDVEVERIELSSKVIKEPVNKIVQIQTVTSRSGNRLASGSVLTYQEYAATVCSSYGWSETDVECLISLWNKESGWNPYACNSSSGAYGIPQALPASKMASKGADYKTNYQTQINWGLSYISSRYGNPQNAWSHWLAKGWY